VPVGETRALVGRNGAGKSTLVAILTGLIKPDAGELRFLGQPAPAVSAREQWRELVGCVYQRSTVIPSMISTTIVPTIIESGVRENVIPSNAKAIVNSRILPGETYQEVEAFVRHAIGDDRVKIRIAGDFANDPSATTDAGGIAFKKVEQAASSVMDDIIPAPFIMLGATDSRAYRAISDGVINFCPLTDSKGFHGIDERLPIKDIQRAISFYKILIKDSL